MPRITSLIVVTSLFTSVMASSRSVRMPCETASRRNSSWGLRGAGSSTSLSARGLPGGRRGSDAATADRDWTICRPEPEEVKVPPPEPISKLLLEFRRSMWRASGGAVEVALQQSQVQTISQDPNATPGQVAIEVFTYSPSKIRKPENL